MAKRINAPFYVMNNGVLYSRGRYKTKLAVSDLPPDYMCGLLWRTTSGAVRASGISEIRYAPNLAEPSMFQYDSLHITYIGNQSGKPDINLGGNLIPIFLLYAEHYSGYDICSICSQIENKRLWYLHAFPFVYEAEIGNTGNIMDLYRRLYGESFFDGGS